LRQLQKNYLDQEVFSPGKNPAVQRHAQNPELNRLLDEVRAKVRDTVKHNKSPSALDHPVDQQVVDTNILSADMAPSYQIKGVVDYDYDYGQIRNKRTAGAKKVGGLNDSQRHQSDHLAGKRQQPSSTQAQHDRRLARSAYEPRPPPQLKITNLSANS